MNIVQIILKNIIKKFPSLWKEGNTHDDNNIKLDGCSTVTTTMATMMMIVMMMKMATPTITTTTMVMTMMTAMTVTMTMTKNLARWEARSCWLFLMRAE